MRQTMHFGMELEELARERSEQAAELREELEDDDDEISFADEAAAEATIVADSPTSWPPRQQTKWGLPVQSQSGPASAEDDEVARTRTAVGMPTYSPESLRESRSGSAPAANPTPAADPVVEPVAVDEPGDSSGAVAAPGSPERTAEVAAGVTEILDDADDADDADIDGEPTVAVRAISATAPAPTAAPQPVAPPPRAQPDKPRLEKVQLDKAQPDKPQPDKPQPDKPRLEQAVGPKAKPAAPQSAAAPEPEDTGGIIEVLDDEPEPVFRAAPTHVGPPPEQESPTAASISATPAVDDSPSLGDGEQIEEIVEPSEPADELHDETVRVPSDPVRERTVLTQRLGADADSPPPAPAGKPADPQWAQSSTRQTQIFAKPEVREAPAWAQRTRATAQASVPVGGTAPELVPKAQAPRPSEPAAVSESPTTTATPAPGASTQPTRDLLGPVTGAAALLLLAAAALPRAVQDTLIAPWQDLAAMYGPTLLALVLFALIAGLAFTKGLARSISLTFVGILGVVGVALAWREASLRQVFHLQPAVQYLFRGPILLTATALGGAICLLAATLAHGRRATAAAAILGLVGLGAGALVLWVPDVLGHTGLVPPLLDLWNTAQHSGIRGDQWAAWALLGGIAVAALGWFLGFAGRPGAVAARALGLLATLGLAGAPIILAVHVSQSLFGILEPVKLAALMAAVLVWMPLAMATMLRPSRRAAE